MEDDKEGTLASEVGDEELEKGVYDECLGVSASEPL